MLSFHIFDGVFEAKILNFDEIQIILFGLLFVFGDISSTPFARS